MSIFTTGEAFNSSAVGGVGGFGTTTPLMNKTLVGSIIDYSAFMIHEISNTNLKKIQAIQNRGLRSIFKQPFDSSTDALCLLGNMNTVYDRLFSLNKNFIVKAIPENGWICKLILEFLDAQNSLNGIKTFLHFYVI